MFVGLSSPLKEVKGLGRNNPFSLFSSLSHPSSQTLAEGQQDICTLLQGPGQPGNCQGGGTRSFSLCRTGPGLCHREPKSPRQIRAPMTYICWNICTMHAAIQQSASTPGTQLEECCGISTLQLFLSNAGCDGLEFRGLSRFWLNSGPNSAQGSATQNQN